MATWTLFRGILIPVRYEVQSEASIVKHEEASNNINLEAQSTKHNVAITNIKCSESAKHKHKVMHKCEGVKAE